MNVQLIARTAKRLGVKLLKGDMEGLLAGDQETIELVGEKIAQARQGTEQTGAAPA